MWKMECKLYTRSVFGLVGYSDLPKLFEEYNLLINLADTERSAGVVWIKFPLRLVFGLKIYWKEQKRYQIFKFKKVR